MIRRPPRSTQGRSSAASDVYKRQVLNAYYQDKQRELEQTLVKELFAKYGAIVHDDVVLRKKTPGGGKPAAGEKPPGEREAQ